MSNIIKETEFDTDVLVKLHNYSEGDNIFSFTEEAVKLKQELETAKSEYSFPAVKDDVGQFLSFLSAHNNFKRIFEFGSGYGHSAYWYFLNNKNIQKVFLTEKRDDMQTVFENLSWPTEWKAKMDYHQGDAFEKLESVEDIDLFLVDGVKGDYLKFVELAKPKLTDSGVIVIDNAFWRGLFLDPENKKSSAVKIGELHNTLKLDDSWNKSFLPVRDGLILLSKKSY